jgi:hypothetical protein
MSYSISSTVMADKDSYCVGTRRTAMIVHAQIEKCSETLQSDFATQFETRMVAEINLYWVIYEYSCGTSVDLPKTQAALHAWKHDWKYVLGKHSPILT